jgi:hypothetical protein
MLPIRPTYIRTIRIYFEGVERFGVRSNDSPTVPNAEKHSKIIRYIPNFPSMVYIPKAPIKMIKIESVIIAKALFTEYS